MPGPRGFYLWGKIPNARGPHKRKERANPFKGLFHCVKTETTLNPWLGMGRPETRPGKRKEKARQRPKEGPEKARSEPTGHKKATPGKGGLGWGWVGLARPADPLKR